MKKLYSLALAVLAVSCGPQIDLSERPLFRDGVNTFTFMLYNALTGEPINDPAATVAINLGNYQLDAVHQEGTNILVMSQVPGGDHLTTVTAPNFVGFLGEADANCSHNIASNPGPAGQCYRTYQVALFPNNSVGQNVTVKAFESATGDPVASGTAVATLTNAASMVGFADLLPGTLTSRPTTLVRPLDGNGSATFEGANLVYGATYSVDIYNATNSSQQVLTPELNETFEAGETYKQLTIFMGPPSESPVALSTSWEEPSHATPQGAFTIQFPYEVEVCSDSTDHYWSPQLGYGDGDLDSIVATPAAQPVQVAGNGGTTLTITPAFSVPADTGDGHLDITFYGIQVQVEGASGCTNLSSIRIRNGSYVVPTIHHVNAP